MRDLRSRETIEAMRLVLALVLLTACGGSRPAESPRPVTPSPIRDSATDKRLEALEHWSEELTIRLNETRTRLSAAEEQVAAIDRWKQSIVPVIQALNSKPVAVRPPPIPSEDGVKIVPLDHPLSCFTTQQITLCASTLEICKGLAKSLKTATTRCESRDSAACYLETVLTSGIRRGWCFGDMTTCQAARDQSATSVDSRDVSECVVERYER